jgi:Bacterial SH3 domain
MTIHPRRPKALAQRLSLLKADTKLHLVSSQKPAVTRIHRRFGPDTPAGATPQHQTPASRLSPGTRALVAVLALVAILPNLALGAIFFLGAVNTPWSAPVRSPPNASSKPALAPAVLSAPTMLEVTAGEDVVFPIALDGTDGVPSRSIITISGLPQGSTLSSGRPYGESEWNLKTDEIGDLHLALPVNASGDAKLTIKLVAPDGIIIADTGLILKIAPAKPAETHGSIEQTQGPGVNKERLTSPSVPTPSGDPVPLPSRRPVPTASHDVDAIWLRPLTFVNLREEPSPSAPVVSVVAKGAKLRVIGRKGRWVQVTHSSSLKSGWVYAGNVTAR